jgi:multicomponent Na+:H+ antiporter subunit A
VTDNCHRWCRELDLIEWALVVIMVASIVLIVRTHSRLTAIAALGGVGSSIAIIFVLYGAIDVAMTQLFVEILVVIFLAIAMVRLPPSGVVPFRAVQRGGRGRGRARRHDGDVARARHRPRPLVDHLFRRKERAGSLGQHRERDPRRLPRIDTMGEVSVVVIAGIAAIAALRAGRRRLR